VAETTVTDACLTDSAMAITRSAEAVPIDWDEYVMVVPDPATPAGSAVRVIVTAIYFPDLPRRLLLVIVAALPVTTNPRPEAASANALPTGGIASMPLTGAIQ
jgi:hypothetical protein